MALQLILPTGLVRPLMEVQGVTLVVVAAGGGLFAASLFLFWQFHRGWKELRRMLEVLDFSTYRAAFEEAGRLLEWNAMRALGRGLTTHRSSLRGRAILQDQKDWVTRVEPSFQACLDVLEALEGDTPRGRRGLGKYGKWLVRLITARQITVCGDVLDQASVKAPVEAATHQADIDLFKALRAIAFIREAFIVLRHLLIGSIGTMILLVLGVSAFDFQPKADLLTLLGAALLGMLAWVAWVILSMERDPLLCLMEGTKPGEVQWSMGLVENGFRFVLVPLLLLLATLNPTFGGVVMQVFNPLMHLLK
jgi:hypothetical protein